MAGYDRRPALAEPAPLLTGAAHAAVQRVVERSLSRHMVRADVIGVTAHPLGRDDEGIGVESDSICWLAPTITTLMGPHELSGLTETIGTPASGCLEYSATRISAVSRSASASCGYALPHARATILCAWPGPSHAQTDRHQGRTPAPRSTTPAEPTSRALFSYTTATAVEHQGRRVGTMLGP